MHFQSHILIANNYWILIISLPFKTCPATTICYPHTTLTTWFPLCFWFVFFLFFFFFSSSSAFSPLNRLIKSVAIQIKRFISSHSPPFSALLLPMSSFLFFRLSSTTSSSSSWNRPATCWTFFPASLRMSSLFFSTLSRPNDVRSFLSSSPSLSLFWNDFHRFYLPLLFGLIIKKTRTSSFQKNKSRRVCSFPLSM